MIKLPLILTSTEDVNSFFGLFPVNFLGNATDFALKYLDIRLDGSAKVQRGFLDSCISLERMGLFLSGDGLFLVDTDKTAMTMNLTETFHGIAMGLGSDPLVRACSLKGQKNNEIVVFDFSAGTLRDSLHLLKAGFKVVAFERHPIVYILLKSALLKSEFIDDLKLFFGDPLNLGTNFFETQNLKAPEIIYFDPMFEGTLEKSAKPRKEMLLFHKLFLERYSLLKDLKLDNSNEAILEFAQEFAQNKVVVKRAPKAPVLKKPTFDFLSKTVRFDVYDVSFKFKK